MPPADARGAGPIPPVILFRHLAETDTVPSLFASSFGNSRGGSPLSLLLPSMPGWLEAGLFGMLLGVYFGLLCAFLYRTRARQAVTLARARWAYARTQATARRRTKRPMTATVTVPGREQSVDDHVESLTAILGDDATAEWRSELRRQQDRLVRLHQALE